MVCNKLIFKKKKWSSKWDKQIKAALNRDTTTKMAFTSISKNS